MAVGVADEQSFGAQGVPLRWQRASRGQWPARQLRPVARVEANGPRRWECFVGLSKVKALVVDGRAGEWIGPLIEARDAQLTATGAGCSRRSVIVRWLSWVGLPCI